MFSVAAELSSHSFIKIGKYKWIFLMKKKKSTATFSNKNYINDCLK